MWLPETKSIPALREWAGIAPDDESHLVALVGRVKKDKTLASLLERGANLLYEKDEQGNFLPLTAWQPPLEEEPGLCLLLALAALPSIRVAHALRHVEEEITRATCRDVGLALELWKSASATLERPIGIDRFFLPWFRLLASGELYRLGRLEFVRETFMGNVLVLQEIGSETRAIVAQNGVMFDRDGYITDIDAPGVQRSSLLMDAEHISGVVIGSDGRATQETKIFPQAEWQIALQAGDPVLTIHIPSGEPLDIDACRESLIRARSFFPAKYPNLPSPVAFVCQSWLLDSAWQSRLGNDLHITRFQKEGLLFPVATGKREGLFYVFGRTDPDPQTAPRDTQLQQAMLRALEASEPLRAGGMYIPFNTTTT